MVTDTLDVNSTQFMQNSGKIIVKKILPCYQRGKERSEMAKYLEHQTYDNLGLSFQILFFRAEIHEHILYKNTALNVIRLFAGFPKKFRF